MKKYALTSISAYYRGVLDLVPSSPKGVTVASPVTDARSLFVAYLAGYGNVKTRREYTRDLQQWASFLDGLDVDVLDAHRVHVDAYVRSCEVHGASPATIGRRLSSISGYYAYALDEDLVAKNPVGRVKRPKVRDESPRLGLDRDEVGRFLSVAEKKPRDLALALLLTLNGLRISEALDADIADLSEERGHRVVKVRRKGGKVALVPLAPRTAAAVAVLIDGRVSGPIFITRSGARLDRQGADKVVKRLAKTAGISKTISPHSLRHTAVTLSLDAGVPLHVVQDMAGHASPTTTQRYNRARHSLDGHATYALSGYVETNR